eukprot:COSAG05_NODE_6305_length_983_cov_5.923077_1_plen_200_part_10
MSGPAHSWKPSIVGMMVKLAGLCFGALFVGAEDFDDIPASTAVKQHDPTSKFQFALEHDVTGTGESFVARNDVSYEGNIDTMASKRGKRPTLRVSKFAFSPDEVESIEALARSGGVYRVRAPTSIRGADTYVVSYVPACALVASRYTENLVFHLGPNGNVVGIDLSTPNNDCGAVLVSPPRQSKKKVPAMSTVRVDLGID